MPTEKDNQKTAETKKVKRTNDIIYGLPSIDKLTIQKTLPVYLMTCEDFNLSDFKLLDLYLSRINSHMPEKQEVWITREEIEEAFGVERMRDEHLVASFRKFISSSVTIPDSRLVKGYTYIPLFGKAEYGIDENGKWVAMLKCSEAASEYFFGTDKFRYIVYSFRSIASLQSFYSFRMYLYLRNNKFRGEWNVPVEQLKKELQCDEDDFYKEYGMFAKRILTRAHKEVTGKTGVKFEYKAVIQGRNHVIAVHFKVTEFPMLPPGADAPDYDEWHAILYKLHFTNEQQGDLLDILVHIPVEKLPTKAECGISRRVKKDFAITAQRTRYLELIALHIQTLEKNFSDSVEAREQILKDKYGYVRKIMLNDATGNDDKA